MTLEKLTPGANPPHNMTVVIEVPEDGHVKYEIDKETGLLKADRVLHTPLLYPANYGYFPGTLGDDGDPLDAVVVCSAALVPGVLIDVRPIGVLIMEDNAGGDEKIICVPTDKVDPFQTNILSVGDLPPILKAKIEYFFAHYKDLETAVWSRVIGWGDVTQAHKIIMDSIARHNAGNK
ncbi:MAG: inorganic diphosphatase [Alphaproteobacteria bacterium]|nr:inorganic diphosphatase [Alphaproteobacteria bacterium]MCL2890104.1 inorganic diphosphatase [Alphaproteobacteria bacterium]